MTIHYETTTDVPMLPCNKIDRILLLGLILSRFLIVFTIPEIRVSSDSQEYLTLAENLRTDYAYQRDGNAETYRTPGYPVFLSLLGTDSPRRIAFAQAVLFALETLLLYDITRRRFGNAAARTVLLLSFFHCGNAVRITQVLSESIFVFVLVATVWAYAVRGEKKAWINDAGVGLGSGILCSIRPIAVWLFIPLALAVAFSQKTRREAISAACSILLGVALTQGVWAARNHAHYGSFYISEISSASLYVYWAQGVRVETSGENLDEAIVKAWTEWDEAKTRLTPPQMKDRFQEKAVQEIVPNTPTVFLLFAKGAIRQIVDSSFTQIALRYGYKGPLTVGEIKQSLLRPHGVTDWAASFCASICRIGELALIALVMGGAVWTAIQAIWANGMDKNRRRLILFALIPIVYLFVLSSAPSANERFREQYFSLAILLAAPWVGERVMKKQKRIEQGQ